MRIIWKSSFLLLLMVVVTGCTNKVLPVQQQTGPSNKACLKEFEALGDLDPIGYDLYAKQFAEINKNYATYKSQGNNVNKDAKEILSLELDAKLQLVCARVKNSVFHSMQKRSVELNSI
ncbi:hypothetical protein [Rahnella sp. Larv3_ips]|uniref:hypothetical protein n=1 Tax=unclassified Rahnella TaxID=2635087 RepID=UPI0013CED71B|nr:hypothetical protein [Rahnella sp. Larv3_ips]MBB6115050.1 hypothetical protein [Rahnella inusitata]